VLIIAAFAIGPDTLQQVLMNPCLNARDAMPTGSQLTIETRNVQVGEEFRRRHSHATPGQNVALIVTDTGVGMHAGTAERIFEPFFKTKEMDRGTGLGFATVCGIVKKHSSFIYPESKPGQGSSFEVYFPAEAGTHEPLEPAPEAQAPGGAETILLAEGHDRLRQSAQEMLQSLGYRVIPAANGRTAVELFKENAAQIDLVVLDDMMPSLGGVDAYLELSKIRAGMEVISTSGYATKPASLSALTEQGANSLQKPNSLSMLSQKIRGALDRKART
jgi:CheY-like chemotaxis protein